MAERNWCNLKILLTGNRGFVGRHIQSALARDGHEIVGIEATSNFDEWVERFESKKYKQILKNVDAIIHAGAIADNQTKDPGVFLWNSHATLVLAQYAKKRYGSDIPFVFFSTFQVNIIEKSKEGVSWYGRSKKFAEDLLLETLSPTILRPSVMWGDERYKFGGLGRSVPFKLATHQLEFLYKDWGRDYVHVSDVVAAIRVALRDQPTGIFHLNGEYWSNSDLAELTDWNDYELIDNAVKRIDRRFDSFVSASDLEGLQQLPNWEYQSSLRHEFRLLETKYGNNT